MNLQNQEENIFTEKITGETQNLFLESGENSKNLKNLYFNTNFIGREIELDILKDSFARSVIGSFQRVLVLGESGVGKTRLVEEFKLNLNSSEVKIFEVICEKGDNAFESLRKILLQIIKPLNKRTDSEKSEILGRFAWDLTRILPELSELPFMKLVEKLPELSFSSQESRFFQATLNLFKNLIELENEPSPIVLVFEEIQNIDEKTLEWLEFFSENFKKNKTLLIGTALEPEFSFRENFEHIQLKPFKVEDLGSLLISILREGELVDSEVAKVIFNHTKGIPLLVEGFVRVCLEEGILELEGGTWRFVFDEQEIDLEFENSEQVFSEILSKISQNAKKLLEVEAVLKSNFNLNFLQKLTELDESQIAENLGELRNNGLLSKEYKFRSSMIPTILQKNFSVKKRKEIHSQVGNFLENEFIGREKQIAEKLANHFTESEETKKAIFYNDLAAEASNEKFAVVKAINYFYKSLELLGNRKEKSQEIKLLLKISRALNFLGEKEKEQKILEEARELALEKRYERLLAEANIALALLFRDLRYFSQVELLLEEALQIAQSLDDIILEIEITKVYGLTDLARENYKTAIKSFNKQLKYSEKFKYFEGKINSFENLGLVYGKLGKFKKATRYFNEVLKKGDLLTQAKSCLNLGNIYFKLEKYEKAIAFYEKSLNIYEMIGENIIRKEIQINIEKAKSQIEDFEKVAEDLQITKTPNQKKNVLIVSKKKQRNGDLNSKKSNSPEENFDKQISKLELCVGKSPQMQEVYKMLKEFSKINFPVCIQGEKGTRKELIAETLHRLSPQKDKFLIVVNCAVIPKPLMESELFGHKKGAFKEATSTQKGKFELAKGSTLFLDEISELSSDLQAKLFRALQKKEFRQLGAKKSTPINFRLIVSTHKDLEEEVRNGKFREDLLHKLDVLKMIVPPLRTRKEDILSLASYFLRKYSQELDKEVSGFTEEAIEKMQNSNWVGNVRELENAIAKAVVRTNEKSKVSPKELFDNEVTKSQNFNFRKDALKVFEKINQEPTLNEKVALLEKFVTEETLKKYKGNITHSAQELGIDTKRVRRILKRHGISKEQF